MSFDSFQDDAWFERQMREVPLPAGLMARLKEVAAADDDHFDAALRDLAIPPKLTAKLHAIPAESALDERLRQVSIPISLGEKLRGIAAYSDAEIDGQLQDVVLPASLLPRLHGIARRERLVGSWRQQRVVQWAVAASLLLMVSSAFYGALAGMIALAYQTRPPSGAVLLEADAPLLLVLSPLEAMVEFPAFDEFEAERQFQEVDLLAVESVELLADNGPLPASETQEILDTFSPSGRGFDPLFNVFLATHVISASPTIDVPLPDIAVLEHHRPRGILPPTVKQFDLLSLIRTGTNPFVSPAAERRLETSRVPLSTDTWSYDRLWRLLRDGELPEANEVFPEEFLAAVNYDFPPATEPGLAIRTAAGPSPFGAAGTHMLQVGVVSGDISATVRQVRYLTFAIDNSLSVARHGRLEAVRQALISQVGQLGARDRFSLVTFGGDAQVLIENAGRDDAEEAFAALLAIQPVRSTNLASGLRQASDTALGVQIDPRIKRSVVLITDSAEQLSGQVFDQLVDLTSDMLSHGAGLEIVDLSGRDEANARLARLASVGGGTRLKAGDPAAIRAALQQILTGSDQVVARETQLAVHFNPKAVEAYRLIGHEPASVGGWIAGPPAIDLRAGETATALYELRLRDSKASEVATIELTWFDPVSKQPLKRTQPVSRIQFTSSLLESPLSLQRAALAAQLAEILRGSPFAPTHRTALSQLEEMSYRMLPAAVTEPSVQRMLDAANRALLVRSGRSLPAADESAGTGQE